MSHSVDEHYSVYSETRRRARKPHTCAACNETISPGRTYHVIFIAFDGDIETLKRCERCQVIHLHLRKLGAGEDMWPAERLDCGEEYKEHWGKEPPPWLAALAFSLPGEALA